MPTTRFRPAVTVAFLAVILITVACGTKDSEPEATAGPSAGASGDDIPAPTTTPPTTVDPGSLPQTKDEPPASSPELTARAQALWDGIVADDVTLAMPFFFPLSAYKQVKDISNPESDWNNRLVAAYAKDIHALHTQLGADAGVAQFVGLEVPESQAQWIAPGGEYNKIGYWRVYGSKLRYTVAGKAQSFPVYSLISWRGEWYVVHLGPIK